MSTCAHCGVPVSKCCCEFDTKNRSSASCIRRERPGHAFVSRLYEYILQALTDEETCRDIYKYRAVCVTLIYAVLCIQPSAIQSLSRDWERRPRNEQGMNVKEFDKWNWQQDMETRLRNKTDNWISYVNCLINAADQYQKRFSELKEISATSLRAMRQENVQEKKKILWGRFHDFILLQN